MMDFLTFDALCLLTGVKHRFYQRLRLRQMGLPFIVRPDGFPVVSTESIRSLLGISNISSSSASSVEPDFDAISNASEKKVRK